MPVGSVYALILALSLGAWESSSVIPVLQPCTVPTAGDEAEEWRRILLALGKDQASGPEQPAIRMLFIPAGRGEELLEVTRQESGFSSVVYRVASKPARVENHAPVRVSEESVLVDWNAVEPSVRLLESHLRRSGYSPSFEIATHPSWMYVFYWPTSGAPVQCGVATPLDWGEGRRHWELRELWEGLVSAIRG